MDTPQHAVSAEQPAALPTRPVMAPHLAVRFDSAQRALVHALERSGWSLLSCELDMHRQTARVELKRVDGRLVTLDARNGKATLTREQLGTRRVLVGAGGLESRRGGLPSDRIHVTFLGRDACLGARHGLKKLCQYLCDNAAAPHALPASQWRALMAPMMSATEVAS